MSTDRNITTQTDGQRASAKRETRCECGQLMAKLHRDGIELKCKRCKRIVLIPFASITGWASPSPTTHSAKEKVHALTP